MAVHPVPEGFHTVTPYLIVDNAPELIEFLAVAFGAEEVHRTTLPDGRVMHAQVQIGDSMVMMGESMEGFPATPASLYLYVPDVDAVYRTAIKAGGASIMEPADQFYGDRNAGVVGPAGNKWWIGTHIEDVAPAEMERRLAQREHAR